MTISHFSSGAHVYWHKRGWACIQFQIILNCRTCAAAAAWWQQRVKVCARKSLKELKNVVHSNMNFSCIYMYGTSATWVICEGASACFLLQHFFDFYCALPTLPNVKIMSPLVFFSAFHRKVCISSALCWTLAYIPYSRLSLFWLNEVAFIQTFLCIWDRKSKTAIIWMGIR